MDILNNLNTKQKEAATSKSHRLQIIAGAGTGKTHTLIARIAYMVNCGVNPLNILLITFTNAAAEEMRERADIETGGRCKNITAMTYHAFCAQELRKYAATHEGYERFEICDDSKAVQIMDLVCKRNQDILAPLKEKATENKPMSPKTILSILSARINTEEPIEKVLKKHGYSEEARDYVEAAVRYYVGEKIVNHIYDFDDLLKEFLHLLKTDIEFRNSLRQRYRYILVDEHQDSNNMQNQITQYLTGPNSFLTVVGDEFQSIYAFRGANVDNFMHFTENYMSDIEGETPDLVTLEENYRSTQEILDLSNNTTRCADFGAPKHLKGQFEGTKPKLYRPDNDYKSAECVLNLMLHYAQDTPRSEIAVLSRNSGDLSYLEGMLNEHDLPYEKHGGPKFFEKEIIQDILAFQGLCVNHYDKINWFRILKLQKDIAGKRSQDIVDTGISEEFLLNTKFAAQKTKTDKSIHSQLVVLHNKFQEFRNEYDPAVQLEKIGEYLSELYENLYEISKSNNKDEVAMDYRGKIEDLKFDIPILLDIMKSHNCSTTEEWLDLVALNPNTKEDDENGDNFILSTIHSAKGLEWDHVILLNPVEGGLPFYKALEDDDPDSKELDDETRLFYVAVTRPRYTLDIVASRFDNRQKKPKTLSRFVEESRRFVKESRCDTLSPLT